MDSIDRVNEVGLKLIKQNSWFLEINLHWECRELSIYIQICDINCRFFFSSLSLFICLADASCLCWTKNLVKLMTYKSSSAMGDFWFDHAIYGVGEARYLKRRITLKRCLKTYYICCPQNIICCSVLMSQYILTHFLRDTRIN